LVFFLNSSLTLFRVRFKADIDINGTHLQAQTLFHRQGKTINIVERTYRQILE
jgi:hypothetical protein